MESIPRFLESSHNPSKITYKHPLLEPILSVTYGCIVYQEQVIDIFRQLGGFSLGQADMIRRAMSKKVLTEIEREKKAFIDGDPERNICGAVANGVPKRIASSIYDEIYAFANYAFNKSHAVAYAIISYQTAYLKCHYPQIYMASLLSSVLDSPERVAEYTTECRNLGIELLPPNINESDAMFTVSGNDLRYGLVAVKNIGRGFIGEVIKEREENGAFKSFEDFCKRVYGNDLNRRALESLIKCGCFDGLGANRRQLMLICQTVIDSVAEHHRRNVEGQMDLFGFSGDAGQESYSATLTPQDSGTTLLSYGLELPDVPEYSKGEMTRMEREVTGLYLSGHPMDDYREVVKRVYSVDIGDVLADFSREDGNIRFKDNQKITLAGVIETVKTKPTRNNSLMAYLTLDDGTGSIELLAFQRVIDEAGGYMQAEALVLAYGRISDRDDKDPQILLETLRPITDVERLTPPASPATASLESSSEKTLYVKLSSEESPDYERLRLVHMMFPGNEQMVIHFNDTKRNVGAKCIIHDAFLEELCSMLGDNNVVVR